MNGQSGDKSFDGGVSVTEASALNAINLSPLHIQVIDDQTFNLSIAYVSYSPRGPAPSTQSLENKILGKIRPAISALLP